jgi:stage IV sporulation protein FB
MNKEYFYDESDKTMFPPKPKPMERQKGMITISLNFVFYILIFFLVFNGNVQLLAAVMMVMFIHEFGHFSVMKKYGYVDKRMFFIPLFNIFFRNDDESVQVSSKEKLLILFAGPVPGILIGFAALFYGDKVQNEQMVGLAWIFLVWNLINLIPLDMLDGGMISETLYPKKNFTIQLLATVLISAGILFYVFVSRNYFSMIIPLFLVFKLNGMKKLNELRNKLEQKGLDLHLNFDTLNNKQYWLIRKELLHINRLPGKEVLDDDYSESVYEGLIMQNIKAVLLNPAEGMLSQSGRIIVTILWFLLLAIPMVLIFSGPWVK